MKDSLPLVSLRGLSLGYDGTPVLKDVDLDIHPGDLIAAAGPNGSGKTTLISCIAGTLRNEGGRILFQGRDITSLPAHKRTRRGIARSFQIPRPFGSMTVLDNLRLTLEYAAGERARGADPTAAAREILAMVGLDAKAAVISAGLTQIELRKLELARAMAAKPALLISDEAMAGLSSSEVDDLLTILFRLNEAGTTVIMIEHIMRAVMRFSERIVVLDAGRKIAEGTPDQVISDPAVERAYLGE